MTPETASVATTIEALESALCDSSSPRTFAPLAEAYRLAGRLDDALRMSERGMAAYPDHVGIGVVMARTLTDLNDFERAREAYLHVLSLDPGNLEALGLIGPQDECAEEDVSLAEPLLEAPPGHVEAPDAPQRPTRSLSEELAHLDDLFVGPISRDETASVVGDPAGIATLTLAEIYSRQGLNREAARVCETILERQPDNEEARRALDVYLSETASV
jgi:tetratricopeptide (TPR) repeat protein